MLTAHSKPKLTWFLKWKALCLELMKSPQIAKLPDCAKYSDLKVLQSQAGYYVGSSYEDGTPGTRDSGYHPSRDAAERTLGLILSGKMNPRLTP